MLKLIQSSITPTFSKDYTHAQNNTTYYNDNRTFYGNTDVQVKRQMK